jgi:hypothetical protein
MNPVTSKEGPLPERGRTVRFARSSAPVGSHLKSFGSRNTNVAVTANTLHSCLAANDVATG